MTKLRIAAVALATLLGVLGETAPASAASDSLLDVLKSKGILTSQEYRRLRGTELRPEQRVDLIETLRTKGILSDAEASRLSARPAVVGPEVPARPAPAEVTSATPSVPIVAPPPITAATKLLTGYDDGFFIRTDDGNFSVKLTGRVASNFSFFEPGTSQTNTETIDRARLGVDASFFKYFRVRLENDFAPASNGLRDAYVSVVPMPEFNVQIGQFKVPFSYEELLSKKYTDFVERAAVVTAAVNPSRDIGIMAYGQLANSIVRYQVAGMNGAGQNRSDNNNDKDVIARVVVAPFAVSTLEHLRGLNAGGAVTYGYQPRETVKQADGTTTAVHNSIVGTTESGFTFFPAVARHGQRLRAGGHIAWLDGPYSIVGEYIHTEEQRRGLATGGGDLPDLDTDGGYIGGTWLLTGEAKPFNARIRPAHRLWDATGVGAGAWEVALRYEYFKLQHGPDQPGHGSVDDRYDALVAGVNWYPNEVLRFSLNYLYGNFEKAGPGLSPNPDKHANNAVLSRVQLEF